MFAYDNVLFCKFNMQENLKIQHLLETYEKASSHKVKREKNFMIFSRNVSTMKQEETMAFWGVQNFKQYEKYLGVPLMMAREKNKSFSYLKHKVWQKLRSWKERLLSQGGGKFLSKQ